MVERSPSKIHSCGGNRAQEYEADLQEAKVLLEELGDKTGVHITR